MAKIKINEAGLRENKKAIEGKISELRGLNAKLDTLIARIDNSWEGEASKQYVQTMTLYKRKADTMIEVLGEFQKYIEQALNQFEEVDRNGANRIRNV